MEHILNLEQVKKYYGGNSGNITKAVDGISMYVDKGEFVAIMGACLLYTSPSPRDGLLSRMPSSAWKKNKNKETADYLSLIYENLV